jgi:hypothetical protein
MALDFLGLNNSCKSTMLLAALGSQYRSSEPKSQMC